MRIAEQFWMEHGNSAGAEEALSLINEAAKARKLELQSRGRMTGSAYGQLEKLESDLREAADQLSANSKLTSSEYCMPVLGVIFLRHATNRFAAAHADIEIELAGLNKEAVKLTKRIQTNFMELGI